MVTMQDDGLIAAPPSVFLAAIIQRVALWAKVGLLIRYPRELISADLLRRRCSVLLRKRILLHRGHQLDIPLQACLQIQHRGIAGIGEYLSSSGV